MCEFLKDLQDGREVFEDDPCTKVHIKKDKNTEKNDGLIRSGHRLTIRYELTSVGPSTVFT